MAKETDKLKFKISWLEAEATGRWTIAAVLFAFMLGLAVIWFS